MPSHKNEGVVAAAGSGKTSGLIDAALQAATAGQRVLLTTYTLENIDEFRRGFVERHGCVPALVTITPWFTFLFREGVRPYQNQLLPGRPTTPLRSIDFLGERNRFQKKDAYATVRWTIPRDKVAEFAYEANHRTDGRVVARLERMFDHLFVDEVQDLAGYDLELLESLLRSSMGVRLVGDPRQGTFSTNRSGKNRGYRRNGVYQWLKKMETAGLLAIRESSESYRCNQAICDFADALFPDLPTTTSRNPEATGHDGIFAVKESSVDRYVTRYRPVVLRYDRRAETFGLSASNIGACKGRTFERVLVCPTRGMRAFLETRDPSVAGDRAKLYVAVTRARSSVAFVVTEKWGSSSWSETP